LGNRLLYSVRYRVARVLALLGSSEVVLVVSDFFDVRRDPAILVFSVAVTVEIPPLAVYT
jgi:hypothetical protein